MDCNNRCRSRGSHMLGEATKGTPSANPVNDGRRPPNQTAVNLHVFSDAPESIAHCLLEKNISYNIDEHRVRYHHDRYELQPTYSFDADDISVKTVVFPVTGIRQPPYCPIDGKPMRRVRLPVVEALLEEHPVTQALSETSI